MPTWMSFSTTMIEDMNKIKQLKTLLAIKDARQLRKDGVGVQKAVKELIKLVYDGSWKEEIKEKSTIKPKKNKYGIQNKF